MKLTVFITIFILGFLYFPNFCISQNTVSASGSLGSIIDSSNPAPTINAKDMPASRLEGRPYLFSDFSSATFGYRGKIFEYHVNIDLISYTLDISYQGDTVFLPFEKIDSLIVDYKGYNAVLNPNSEINFEVGQEKSVIISQLNGPYNILIKRSATIKEPDFDPRFNIGSVNYKIVEREEIFISKDKMIISPKRKIERDKDFYAEDYSQLCQTMKINHLDYTSLHDLVEIFSIFNTFED